VKNHKTFFATKQLKRFKIPKTHPPKAYQPQTNIYKSITKTFKNKNKTQLIIASGITIEERNRRTA